MPDVGVLQLTIRDNSKDAATGLENLSDALVRVKHAVIGGLGLEGVANEVVKLHNVINSAKGTSSTISKLGTMFNAIEKFSKIKSFNINAEQLRATASSMNSVAEAIERQNNAVAKSITNNNWWDSMLGNSGAKESIKEAKSNLKSLEDLVNDVDKTGSGWANAWRTQLFSSRPSSRQSPGQISMDLDGTQAKLEEIVSNMQVTDAVAQNVKEHVKTSMDGFTSALNVDTIASPIDSIAESFSRSGQHIRYFASGIDAVLPKISSLSAEQRIEAENARLAAMSEKELRITLLDAQGALANIKPIPKVVDLEHVETTTEFNIALRETGDIVESVIIPRFNEMYQIWSEFAYEFGMFKMAASTLTAGDNPLLLGDGRTPGQLFLGDGSEPETFLVQNNMTKLTERRYLISFDHSCS